MYVLQGKDFLPVQVCIRPRISSWLKVILRLAWQSAEGCTYAYTLI